MRILENTELPAHAVPGAGVPAHAVPGARVEQGSVPGAGVGRRVGAGKITRTGWVRCRQFSMKQLVR